VRAAMPGPSSATAILTPSRPPCLPITAAENVDGHPAVFAHSFQCIHHQVGKDLPQFSGVAVHNRIKFILARKLDTR